MFAELALRIELQSPEHALYPKHAKVFKALKTNLHSCT